MPKVKAFGKKNYKLHSNHTFKRKAEEEAEKMRRKGHLARVLVYGAAWSVWVRYRLWID